MLLMLNYIPNRGAPALGLGIGLVLLAFTAFSETTPDFSLRTTPELPQAGERVTISVLPTNFAAASTTFTWFRDGVKASAFSGLGRSSFRVETDPSRQEIIPIRVEVAPGPGFEIRAETTVVYTLANLAQPEADLAVIASEFSLEASSLIPDPGESVSIEVVTFAFDKSLATYQWYADESLERTQSGRGRTRFTLAGPVEGAAKTVRVEVTLLSGQVRSKSLTIRSTSAPLYWWADTAVPYWYKGKALPSLHSRVTMMALPNVSSPRNLSYQWQLNGGIIPQASGFGLAIFSLELTLPVEEQIEVKLKDAAGTFEKSARTSLAPVLPSAGIYALKPLRGAAYEQRLAEFTAPSGEDYDLVALPFFFPRGRLGSLTYRWFFNGQAVEGTFDQPGILTIKSPGGSASTNQVGIEITDPARGGERASASARITFRQQL